MVITKHMHLSKKLKKELSDRLKASKIALERADNLHKLGDYSGAVFSIQQSSELMSKYIIALIEKKEGYDNDTKKYKHDMHKLNLDLFTKPFENFEKKHKKNPIAITTVLIFKNIMQYDERVEEYKKLTENNVAKEKSYKKMRCASYEELKKVIEAIQEITDTTSLFSIHSNLIEVEILLKAINLFPIALYSSAHQFTTRYTDGDIKPWEYNENVGIVEAIPIFLKNLNSIYLNIEKMNEKLK